MNYGNRPKQNEHYTPKTIIFSRKCTVTNKLYEVEVTKVHYDDWLSGTLIQNAFPELNADQREFLKLNVTPAEWDAMMGPEE